MLAGAVAREELSRLLEPYHVWGGEAAPDPHDHDGLAATHGDERHDDCLYASQAGANPVLHAVLQRQLKRIRVRHVHPDDVHWHALVLLDPEEEIATGS